MSNEQAPAFTQARDQVRKRQTEELSKRILSSINNTFVGDETKNWLSDVSENVDANKAVKADDNLCQLNMVELMDQLFDDFYRYSYQFNQTEESQTFVTACNRPEASSVEHANSLYQGSLQNSVWGMLVTGDAKAVRFSFVKPESLGDEHAVKVEGPVFFELFQHPHPEGPPKVLWTADGAPVKSPHLPYLSKKIFARLIRVSRGEVSETERLPFDSVSEGESVKTGEVPVNAPKNNIDVITYSLISLLEAIDSELEAMQQQGMNLLRSGGMEAVAPVVKRTQAFRAMRERAAALGQDWSSLI